MVYDADAIATAVLSEFDKLPAKRKPPVRDNGVHEWVPLSGIVAVGQSTSSVQCLALATGMKCLPRSKVPAANGMVLHDWHAEILAIRAFNHFVLKECRSLAAGLGTSEFLRLRTRDEIAEAEREGCWGAQPFAWRDDVSLHMYCSEAPCGDASMELIMAAQDDDTPWEVPPELSAGSSTPGAELPGRAYFSRLGVVRSKPARGDAQRTLSKSCSDKLAMRQCTSLLSSLASLLVHPRGVYLRTLVMPESQYSAEGCRRSFSAEGRMKDLVPAVVDGEQQSSRPSSQWPGGYGFRPFDVQTTSPALDFAYSRRSAAARASLGTAGIASSQLAVAWTRTGLEEATMAGVLQGRKQTDPRAASVLCRRRMWGLALEISSAQSLGAAAFAARTALSNAAAYRDVKECDVLAPRRRMKELVKASALRGWTKNDGDDAFGL